jgi:mono/diheme cytochrome c family protein
MTRSKVPTSGLLSVALLAIVVGLALAVASPRPAYALPEYAARTGEPCGTCHVSPGGGGPRTMRGLLWIADGRPDQVRTFENILIAPGVDDPQVLYDAACAGCHGSRGEGLSGGALVGFDFSETYLHRIILDGATDFGMPSFTGQFSDAQLEALTQYVHDLSAGRIVLASEYPLPPVELNCASGEPESPCGGN